MPFVFYSFNLDDAVVRKAKDAGATDIVEFWDDLIDTVLKSLAHQRESNVATRKRH
jgi:hypothetical protein